MIRRRIAMSMTPGTASARSPNSPIFARTKFVCRYYGIKLAGDLLQVQQDEPWVIRCRIAMSMISGTISARFKHLCKFNIWPLQVQYLTRTSSAFDPYKFSIWPVQVQHLCEFNICSRTRGPTWTTSWEVQHLFILGSKDGLATTGIRVWTREQLSVH